MMMIISTLYAKHCFKSLIYIGLANPYNNASLSMMKLRGTERVSDSPKVKTGKPRIWTLAILIQSPY